MSDEPIKTHDVDGKEVSGSNFTELTSDDLPQVVGGSGVSPETQKAQDVLKLKPWPLERST